MYTKDQVQELIKRSDKLEGQASNWRSYHQEIASLCLPRKAWQVSVKSDGERLKLGSLFDSTAIRSLRIMSAGFHSNLTNPSSKWFTLQTRKLATMQSRNVTMWFKDVEDIMFSTLSSSNFDTTMQEFYLNAGSMGTGIIQTLEDVEDKVRFKCCSLNQVVMEEDAQGRVNRLYFTETLTVQQAFDLWGNDAGEAVTDKIKNNPTDKVTIIHYVGPRDKRDVAKGDSKNMPWMSLYIEKSKKHIISEGGFHDFPYAVGRFYKENGDVWGFSPAMDAFAEIALVNGQQKTMLRASMKASDPAIILPRSGYVLPLSGNPGAVNYRDGKTTKAGEVETLPTSGNIPITLEVISAVQNNIKESFFVPLFQALSAITKQMTVPEVQRRIAENMVLLGPVVGRFTDETLDPLLLRVFSILLRNGELPEVPEELVGQDLDIVYISPLAKAQKESEMFSIDTFLNRVGAIAPIVPTVIDKFDSDEYVDVMARMGGINPGLIRSDADVEAIRAERAEAQAQQAQMAMMAQGAATIKDGAAANKDLADASKAGK